MTLTMVVAQARSLIDGSATYANSAAKESPAIDAAAKETGIGKEVLQAMIVKLLDSAKDQAVDAMKEQGMAAAKGMFGKFFGR